MPPRPKDIPHNIERTALQKMTGGRWLPTAILQPASTLTIEGCSTRAGLISKWPKMEKLDIALPRPVKRH